MGTPNQSSPARARYALRDPRPVALLLALLCVWAPLPFGSVTLEAKLALLVAIWVLFIASVWTIQRRRAHLLLGSIAALAALALLGLFQSIPLAEGIVEALSPQRVAMSQALEELELGASAAETGKLPLSVAPSATLTTALAYLSFAALLLVAATAGRERSMRRLLAASLLGAALFQTIYGGGRFLGDTNRIWGVTIEGATGRFRGTFVNPDHFAFYVGLILPLVFAWGWWAAFRARRAGGLDTLAVAVLPPLLCWSALFVGLALSGSRGGLMAAVVAVCTQGVICARASRRAPMALAGAVFGGIGIASVLLISREQGLGRLLETSAYEVRWNARFEVWAAAFELWRDFPWLGTGLGSFRDAFPWGQPPELVGVWWHAHNDWLEILLTAGVLGAVLVVFGVVTLLLRLIKVLLKGRRSEDRAAAIGALGAVTAASLHSIFDFGLTMPANAFTLAVICGAAATASLSD